MGISMKGQTMDLQHTLQQAINEKKRLLSEDVGKTLISQYGIEVPPGKRVTHPGELRAAARKLGYPLVVKVMAPELIHKTDQGAVKLGIAKYSALQGATEELWTFFPGMPLLVEKMIRPGVEMILGLTHDSQFGPSLMMGLGGIFTEVFQFQEVLPAVRHFHFPFHSTIFALMLESGFPPDRPEPHLYKIFWHRNLSHCDV